MMRTKSPSAGEPGPQRRDYAAGALMLLVGIAVLVQAERYHVGSLTAMGPGFFPMVLGAALGLVGVLIILSARTAATGLGDTERVEMPDVRGTICIISGVLCFIALAPRLGMFPATLACVLVAAFGDRTTSARGAIGLALAVSIGGVLLFAYFLKIPLPAFRW